MPELQLDLFSDRGVEAEQGLSPSRCPAMVSADIEDELLIAAIAGSDLADSCELAGEAGRRQLAAAVPALAALCRRFAGFGTRRLIPEQAAAIEALALIGGGDAADAVAETIERAVVQGPGLQIALSAAARLGSRLSSAALRQLLQHAEPVMRVDACRCARPLPELISLLIDLLDDLNRGVAISAACALGRMGRIEARSQLKSLLRDDPSGGRDRCNLVNCRCGVRGIARPDCSVRAILADAALASLENIELASAAAVAAAARRLRLPQQNSEHNSNTASCVAASRSATKPIIRK